MRVTWTLVLAGSLLATVALGTDYDVTTGGTDTASCGTGANPKCKTITYAVGTRASGPADRVLVGDGTYSDTMAGEVFPIVMKNGVSVIGDIAMPQDVVVKRTSNGSVLKIEGTLGASTTIAGLTLQPGGTSTATGIQISGLSGAETVQAVIEDNRFDGGKFGLRAVNVTSTKLSPTIRDNAFLMQGVDGILFSLEDAGAMQLAAPTISMNQVTSPGEDGIDFSITDDFSGNVNPTVTGNTVSDPGDDGIEVVVTELDDTSNVVGVNATISGNTVSNADDEGMYVAFNDQTSSDATNASVTLKATITGNTVNGTTDGDGIRASVSSLSDSVTSLDVVLDATITGNEVNDVGSDGIDVEVSDLSTMTNGSLTVKALVTDNMVDNAASAGIEVEVTDLDEVGDIMIGPITVRDNTVTGSGENGINLHATSIASSASGFEFSPLVKGNTVTGSGGDGVRIAYSDTNAAGTVSASSNVVTGNGDDGVEIEIDVGLQAAHQPACQPPGCEQVRVALRGNTVTGNGGDAVRIFGGTTTYYDSSLMTTVTTVLAAEGDYVVDLGGGFKGGNGLNALIGNTSPPPAMAAALPGTCAGGAYCDINNFGPADVAAQCNQFTETDMTAEEQWLYDFDDDPLLGQITPISYCQVLPTPTPTPVPQPPVVETGLREGSTEVCGTARPDLMDGCLQVVRLGPPDVVLGSGGSAPDGDFCIDIAPPLALGDRIVVRDICAPNSPQDPLDGPVGIVGAPAPAPALSPLGLVAALLALAAIARLGWPSRS